MKNANKFGSVWAASGAQGTFGEGYWYHWPLRLLGLCFFGITFVAKTVTTYANAGNTPLKNDGFTPKGFILKSVYLTLRLWWQKVCLNCYGLSQNGTIAALAKNRWQKRRCPWMISFMPVGSKDTWIDQARQFVKILGPSLPSFKAYHLRRLALQFNASCPNIGKDPLELAPFMKEILDILSELGVLIFVKINAQFPVELAKEVAVHPACAGLIMGNTLPFGASMPDGWPQVPWDKLFGTSNPEQSPLALRFDGDKLKAGGLSGAPLLPIVCAWIRKAREAGITCHINAGGGINSPIGAWKSWKAGADSISLGTITIFRPWLMLPTVLFAKILFGFFEHRK